jgi:hypothetical protein
MDALELLIQEMKKRIEDGLVVTRFLCHEGEEVREGRWNEASIPLSVQGEEEANVCKASIRRDTNRPMKINQLQRWTQMLTAMETQSTGLQRPNERSKMTLFIAPERIWWPLIKWIGLPRSSELPRLCPWSGQHTPGNKDNNHSGRCAMFVDEKMMTMVKMVDKTWREMEYMCTGMYEVRRVDPHW